MDLMRKSVGILSLASTIVMAGGSASAGYFTNTGSLGSTRTFHTATLLHDGRVLVTGGGGYDGFLSTSELFNPTNRTWTLTGSLQFARDSHTATMLPNGKVMVAGGGSDVGSADIAEVFDPSTGEWTNAGALTESRGEHTATLFPGGDVLVAGGLGCCGVTSSTELYSQTNGNWVTNTAMNLARRAHTATLLPNGEVLVAGGNVGFPLYLSAELYNPTNRTWRLTGQMIEVRNHHTATLLLDGRVLVTGGFRLYPSPRYALSSCELFDPATGEWTSTGSMATERQYHQAILLSDGRVLAVSGYASCEIYDPSSGTWTVTGWMNTDRSSGHTATRLSDGNVLVAGGSGYSVFLSSSELFLDVSPFVISSHQWLPSGTFRLKFTGPHGASFTALGTTNLSLPISTWTVLGNAVEMASGQFQFTDTQTTNFQQRCYRVRAN